jgi:hypothetical protein
MTDDKLTTVASGGAVVQFDYSQFEGSGFENASKKDLTTPYILALQDLSKATKSHEAAFVPGAKAGMFLNTGTRELTLGVAGFAMVPLHIDHCVVEWTTDRKFVARHPVDSPIFAEAKVRFEANTAPDKSMAKDIKTPAGNSLVETYYLWTLLLDADGETPLGGAIVPFKSSNIKVYRKQVYTPLYSFKGAGGKLYPHRLRCTLVLEPSPKGASYNYSFSPLRGSIRDSLIDPGSPLMAVVYETYRQVVEGRAKMADEAVSDAAGDEAPRDEVFS